MTDRWRPVQTANVILIGMPGAGKSTVGVLLAKRISRDFLDTDILIQAVQGRPLQEIVDTDGYMELRKIEEATLLGLSVRNHVIATGGSAAYSAAAMAHLRSTGTTVFLDVDITVLQSRVRDFATRGLAKRADQTFADLFAERLPLYRKYADITIGCSDLTQDEICARIIRELGETK